VAVLVIAKSGTMTFHKMFVLSNLGFLFCKIRKLDKSYF
jgi:hypothetical protein